MNCESDVLGKEKIMNRTKLNFIVDTIAFILFTFLFTTGMLIYFVLPPQSGHLKTVLAMTRHQWGEIHFYIAFTLVLVLVAHFALHWKWVVCVIKGHSKEKSNIRLFVGAIILVILLVISLAILLSPIKSS